MRRAHVAITIVMGEESKGVKDDILPYKFLEVIISYIYWDEDMPDSEVKTVRDIIFYQYAKLIARSSKGFKDGSEAKKKDYGFIKVKFRQLRDGEISWSDILREDKQFADANKSCIYCGSDENLQYEHIVPKSLKIKPHCSECDTIQHIHNQINACKNCNSSKGTLGLYKFYQKLMPDKNNFFDYLPSLVEKKYLKTIYQCHNCANTLDKTDLDGDGYITVFDIDWIVK
jgi:5-methylcytosine-specific restriction endonuclease McrA